MSAPAQNTAPMGGQTGQQDALDKGIDAILKKGGHGQSAGTVEKISDGFRKIFKKVAGKDVPIADKQ
ncbi:hypothetical protein CF327_g4005 [Tilletia walkeri]|uniref:Uncharacterized protein n=1 Tax=Tilletia walkeri TaxID=117179 RepID=A0A8X7NCF1_9BASI|nr:hypothetical protein CF327_g4005 [Tilletia walkeri]KAE8217433.1 hypothetical protein CF326_g9445 [Tilletia indica]KAE8270694.1 hypothetical protein A4X09_0g1662 [Tilletia walkeri]